MPGRRLLSFMVKKICGSEDIKFQESTCHFEMVEDNYAL